MSVVSPDTTWMPAIVPCCSRASKVKSTVPGGRSLSSNAPPGPLVAESARPPIDTRVPATGPAQETTLPAIAPAFTNCPGALSIEAAWLESPTSAARACSTAGVASPRRVSSDPSEAGASSPLASRVSASETVAATRVARIAKQAALSAILTGRHRQWIMNSWHQLWKDDMPGSAPPTESSSGSRPHCPVGPRGEGRPGD